MGRTGWDAKFPEPIPLSDGSKLATLCDAIAHLGKFIPKPNMTSGGKPPQTGPAYASKHWSTGGEYPDTMPQAIKLIDAKGRSCIYVPITQDDKVVDSQGFMLDAEDE